MWILGDFKTLSNSKSVWEDLVHDAKTRGCFFNVDSNIAISKNVKHLVPLLLDSQSNVDINGGECVDQITVAGDEENEKEEESEGRRLEIMKGRNTNVEDDVDQKAVTHFVSNTSFMEKIKMLIIHCVSRSMGKILGI